MKSNLLRCVSLALVPIPSLAQQAPDAGRILQENMPQLQAPRPSPDLDIRTPGEPRARTGKQVALSAAVFSGNTVLSDAMLQSCLGPLAGKTYDYPELMALTDRVSACYRDAGYPFVKAILPPQDLSSGTLTIHVVEGRYGKIETQGDPRYTERAHNFVDDLQHGALIESGALERATLILGDQPGIATTPVIRPGQHLAEGDLIIDVQKQKPWGGEFGLDNSGSRYTGRNRAHFNVDLNSPFTFGDQLSLKSLYSEEGLWFGSLGYQLPLGGSGLRAHASVAHTYYELGKDFSSLSASGVADVYAAGLSYPLIRSQRTNLTLSATATHKVLDDRQGAVGTSTRKSSDSLPLALAFDTRDALGGGAVTYGSASWTTGHLHLDDSLSAVDRTTAHTGGNFNRANLDIVRLQTLGASFSLSTRIAAQFADKNLDSSEKFGLGGPNGVRAYPTGEGYGDQGQLAQLELRYAAGAYTPFTFYDVGSVRTNKTPWTTTANQRSIAGAGFGLRFAQGGWRAETTLAWATHGGRPLSDNKDERPVLWGSLVYQF